VRDYGNGLYGSGYYGMGNIEPDSSFLVEAQIAGAWTDITCDARALDIKYGRSDMLASFTAGTMTIAFANFNDRYSAWNAFGLWAQNGTFRSSIPIRVRVITNGRIDPLFAGTTDEIQDSWPGTVDALATIYATDGLKGLTRARIPVAAAVGAGELSGARVARILTAAGWTGPTSLDAGQASMAATTFDAPAIDLLDATSESEFGEVYVAMDGTLVFRDRQAVTTNPRMINVQWTFVDRDSDLVNATCVCYSDLKLTANDDKVYNKATITRTGGTAQVAQQADSLGWYGPRTYTRDNLPLNDEPNALTLAQLIVANHAYNERRIESIRFNPLYVKNGPNVATGIRLLDRVRLLRHTTGGLVIDAELLVQSITHEIEARGDDSKAGSWTVTIGTANARSVKDAGWWDVSQWDQGVWGP
jgi:hypothetical protein